MTGFRATISLAALAIGMAMTATAAAQNQTTLDDPAQQPGAVATEEDILVTGVRGNIIEALEIERQADTVISVITADDIGQFADQNVAESLQRIPGVTILRSEGEGREIQVRGLSSDFNQVVINGAQVGSSNPDGGRSVTLDVISSELLSGVRVAKTLTPDTDHDSLGAQVNLLTLSAFDRPGTTGRLRVEGGLAEYSDRISKKIAGDFTTRLAGDTLGIAFAFNYFDRFIQGDELRDDRGAENLFALPNGRFSLRNQTGATRFLRPGEVDQRVEVGNRERLGGTFQIDYRPDEDNRWALAVLAGRLKDDDVRLQQEWETRRADRDSEIRFAGPGNVRLDDVELEQQVFFQDITDQVISGNFTGFNRFGAVTVDYGADYSKSRFTLPAGLRGRFRGRDLLVNIDFDRDSTSIDVLDGDLDPSEFEFDDLLIIDEKRTDEIWSAYANAKYDFAIGGADASLKIGGKYRDRDKVIRRGEFAVSPADEDEYVDAGLPTSLAGLPLVRPANSNIRELVNLPSPRAARALFQQAADFFDLSADDEGRVDYDAREKTFAAYVQGQIDFSPSVTLIGGVRMERTEYTATGVVVERIERDEVNLPAINSGLINITNRYTKFFPSVHLRADVAPTVVGRLSLSRAQVRPTFGDARALQEIDTIQVTQGGQLRTVERVLDGGNPAIRPLIADQADATLGWYPSRGTALTAAAFYKKLKNPFISATFQGENVALASLDPLDPAAGTGFSEADVVGNAGSGRLYGVELGASHFFTWAPVPLDGFFVTGNLTLINGKARSEFVRDGADFRLDGQASIIANFSAGFENDRFTGRVSVNHIGDRLSGLDSSDPEFDVLRAPFTTVDVNLRFQLTPMFQVYMDLININNARDIRYQRGLDGVEIFDRISDFGRTFQLGALLRF